MRKIILGLLAFTGLAFAATSALYLHHERSTQATTEADCQNREICLDKTNLDPLGRFNDGTLFHVVTQEKPNVQLTGTLGITGALTASNSVTMATISANRVPYTTTGGLVTQSANLTYDGTTLGVNNATISGSATTTGVHTFTAAPVFSSATASLPMFTNGSKALVSNAMTGTGNVVMSASPTLTGTTSLATLAASGNLNVNGAADASGYGVNALNKSLSATRSGGSGGTLILFGVGTPATAANSEYMEIYHDAASNAVISVDKQGTGTVRNILFKTGGTTALTITSTQAATFSSTLSATAATDNASSLQVGGSVSNKITALTSNTTLTSAHNTIEAAATGGSFTITLPAASGCTGRRYAIHKNDVSSNTVTVDGNASETIDGALTIVLGGNVGNSHLVIVSNGTGWRIEWLYEEGTFTATGTGFTTSITSTARYTRIGKSVTLNVPQLVGTSNSTSFTITGTPSFIVPLGGGTARALGVYDNGIEYPVSYVLHNGTATLSVSFCTSITSSTTTFTSSGFKGIYDFDMSYLIP